MFQTKTYLIALASIFSLISVVAEAQEAATKQYQNGQDIPLVWILDEWHQKHPSIELFLCVCTVSTCDVTQSWPFREYNLGEVMPALGNSNRGNAESIGFTCGLVAPDAIQGIGG